MRPSAPALSGPAGGKSFLGWWGDAQGPKQVGITQYSLSPFKQRPFAGALHGYLFNGFSRIMQQVPYFAIPFGTGYFIYTWAKNTYAYNCSKIGHHELAQQEGGH
ncbi:Cytochrome b-c1 complex subunit 8, mitochondrial [Cryptotrichosporon argae]